VFEPLDTSKFKELEWPEELKPGWGHHVFFKDHKTLGGISMAYFNDKHPVGSVFIGDYILNDYPDVYATWTIGDEFGNTLTDRLYVSPIFRNKGVGTAALSWGLKYLKFLFDRSLHHEYGPEHANSIVAAAFDTKPIKNTPVEETIDLREQFFEQPAHPYIFFGKRVVG
jgi:GNAT superfamily N-acetyltransferase